MTDYKELLCGHLKEIFDDAASKPKNVLQKGRNNYSVHNIDRPRGSYVLVNIPSQERRYKPSYQVRQIVESTDQRGDPA
jgi:hypothetical protein